MKPLIVFLLTSLENHEYLQLEISSLITNTVENGITKFQLTMPGERKEFLDYYIIMKFIASTMNR